MKKSKKNIWLLLVAIIIGISLGYYLFFEAPQMRGINESIVGDIEFVDENISLNVGTSSSAHVYLYHNASIEGESLYITVFEARLPSFQHKSGTGEIELPGINDINKIYLKDDKSIRLIWRRR